MHAPHDRFLAAILAADFPAALATARAERERGVAVLYEDVVTPALVEVGRMWQRGRISVADEHIASAIAQSVLASLYGAFPWPSGGPRGIIACVPGERHELGARMAADQLAYDGWDVTYVGADVPLESLVELVSRQAPVFVGLSAAMADRLQDLRGAVARLREAAPRTKLIVGGRVVGSESPPLVEADFVAPSAASAVEAIRGWKR